jgi:hypothetical protein
MKDKSAYLALADSLELLGLGVLRPTEEYPGLCEKSLEQPQG